MQHFEKFGRRGIVQAFAASVAGSRLYAETLALSGGPKAVTFPAARKSAILKWPRYGPEEKNAISTILDNNTWYAEIPVFEKELKEYLRAAYVKAHMNGTSALMSMFFALDLP